MSIAIRNWREARRFRTTLQHLRSLSPQQLRALGISPSEIEHLAQECSRL